MIFLMQFVIINKHWYTLHLPQGLVQRFVALEKFTCPYLFRIALEII